MKIRFRIKVQPKKKKQNKRKLIIFQKKFRRPLVPRTKRSVHEHGNKLLLRQYSRVNVRLLISIPKQKRRIYLFINIPPYPICTVIKLFTIGYQMVRTSSDIYRLCLAEYDFIAFRNFVLPLIINRAISSFIVLPGSPRIRIQLESIGYRRVPVAVVSSPGT